MAKKFDPVKVVLLLKSVSWLYYGDIKIRDTFVKEYTPGGGGGAVVVARKTVT